MKYRRLVVDDVVDKEIEDICLEIGKRYEIHFVEIGTDKDHVHFLVQSVPALPVTRIVTIIKSITARQVFDKMPELKKQLWGSSLWTVIFRAKPEQSLMVPKLIVQKVETACPSRKTTRWGSQQAGLSDRGKALGLGKATKLEIATRWWAISRGHYPRLREARNLQQKSTATAAVANKMVRLRG